MFVPHVKEERRRSRLPSQPLSPLLFYLPDPLCDDLITVFNACDLNGVLIASNVAIWHRDAVHLVPVKLVTSLLIPAHTSPFPHLHYKYPVGTFTASLNYISLIFGKRNEFSGLTCKSVQAA